MPKSIMEVSQLHREIALTTVSDCEECHGQCGRWDSEAMDQWYPCSACYERAVGVSLGLAAARDQIDGLVFHCRILEKRFDTLKGERYGSCMVTLSNIYYTAKCWFLHHAYKFIPFM